MDKEQIIIDGVDVSECEDNYRICVNTQEPEVICKKYKFCSKNPNCYFKQLQREKQDNQSLLNVIDDLRDKKNHFEEMYNDLGQECDYWKHQVELGSEITDRIAKQLEEKEQECEELKEELQTSKDDHAYAVELEKDIDRFEQALNEIKEIAAVSNKPPCLNVYDCSECANCSDDLTSYGELCMQYGLYKILQKCEAVQNGQ